MPDSPSLTASASPHHQHHHDPPSKSEVAKWKKIVAEFEKPCRWRASWQLSTTVGLYAATWAVMYFALQVSAWAVVPLIPLAGGLLVRIFIIFHDCCHNSFYKTGRLNQVLGYLTGVLVFTPFKHWRWEHSVHHATAGDLDRRGIGDIWTLTVDEYLKMPRRMRIAYRAARNPFILFFLAPLYLFVVRERFASAGASKAARRGVLLTNLGVITMVATGCWVFGILPFLLIQLGVLWTAAAAGVWLFYVQHQFEGVYWERHEHWEYTAAALEGSSYYKLPKLLQWFSGNIGFHHIHHLSSKIPNYHLEACHYSHPAFREIKPLTIWSSLKSFSFRLWDEAAGELVGWKRLREVRAQRAAAAA